MTITYGADDTAWGSHWACTQTQVVSSLNERVIIYNHIKDGIIPVTPKTPSTDIPKKSDGSPAVDPNSLTKEVDLKVNYVNSDRTTFTGEPPANQNQKVTFTGTAYVDKVTGKLVNAKQQADGTWVVDDSNTKEPQIIWKADDKDSFDAVISPSEAGYYVDRVDVKVGDQQLDKDKDTDEYSAYTDGKDVKAIDGIDHNHADITITVHYAKYYYAGSEKETTTVTRTINYLDRKTGEKIPSNLIDDNPVKQTATLSRTKIVDHDGNLIGYGKVSADGKSYTIDSNWHVDENHWSDLGSPDLSGYGYTDPVFDNGDSAAKVQAEKVDVTNPKDQTVNIYYDHKIAKVDHDNPGNIDKDSFVKRVTETVQYEGLPDKKQQTLEFRGTGYRDQVTGDWTDAKGNKLGEQKDLDKILTWSAANDKTNFDQVDCINREGYYVTDATTDDKTDYYDGNGHVKAIDGIDHNHADITITVHYAKYYYAGSEKETTTVTRTINYLDRKTGEKIPSNLIDDNPVKQTATLSRTKIVDHDGNLIGYGKVSADGKSYTIDSNWHVDENHWSDLGSPDLSGYGYTDPVFDNGDSAAKVQAEKVDVTNPKDQTVNIYYDHTTTTVTSENPGKPGEPVDPDNPDGPKYPDGTDEYQVKRTGTQTIHYVGAGDKTPADNKQTFIFTREITFDDVTGKIISVTPWNVQSHTFGNVDTPVIPGYHADKAVAGGETVTPDDLNKVITVTYAPDGNPGNPSDHGDTPSPEPTPEPETTPNPTPDDQHDSEISSDDNFEKVKAKDRLDKTNPKKVAAYKKERKIIKTKIAKQGHTEIAEPIEDKVTRENNVKVVSDPVENKAAEPKLPQTGEADNSIIGLLGMLLASFAAMFGFDSLHSHDKKHKN